MEPTPELFFALMFRMRHLFTAFLFGINPLRTREALLEVLTETFFSTTVLRG